ncbi:MAG: ATP--guanido phosphotransferase, partial [Candidatus Omnitrophota bacterium]|nr:ATP--guanido phosphotransferase [Candidatus Omnitrophota bacterium]
MTIDDFLKKDSEWLKGTGPNSDIVMSSRVRLARNLEKLAFSHWADKKQQESILSVVFDAAKSVD